GGDVPADQFVFVNSVGQSGAQGGPDAFDRPWRYELATAFADRAATAAFLGSAGGFALCAALAYPGNLVQAAPPIRREQRVQPLSAQVGIDVEADEQLVPFVGLRREVGFDDLAQPVSQILVQRWHVRRDRATVSLYAELEPCPLGVLVRGGLDVLAAPDTVRAGDPGVGTPATWDRVDRSLAVAARAFAAHAIWSSATRRMWSSTHSGRMRR